MNNCPFENKIVIVGSDHHNTLAAIRAFGKKKCDIAVVVHGNHLERKKIKVVSSKYVNQHQFHIIENNKDELIEILQIYGDAAHKTILFPCSDFAEMVFDSNYNLLKQCFLFPGFFGAPGKVCEMMDKWNQYLFAQKYGVPMAPTFLASLKGDEVPSELSFPCIIKPRVSAFGSKTDIVVCESRQMLLEAFAEYRKKGYSEGLVQAFINKDYEANSLGFVLTTENRHAHVGAIAVKIREQLESATSYAMLVGDMNSASVMDEGKYVHLFETNQKIIHALQDDGYSGHYDIEYLVCGNTVYLNEINFRQSGNGYALVNRYVNAPFLWACGILGDSGFQIPGKCVDVGSRFMAELYDKMYLKKHPDREALSIHEWIQDIRKSDAFAVFDRKDLRATIRIYFDAVSELIVRMLKRSR